MADLTRKELGDALQTIAEQFQAVDKSLAKIAVGFMALKGFVARQANPSAPKEALAQIQELEAELEKIPRKYCAFSSTVVSLNHC